MNMKYSQKSFTFTIGKGTEKCLDPKNTEYSHKTCTVL